MQSTLNKKMLRPQSMPEIKRLQELKRQMLSGEALQQGGLLQCVAVCCSVLWCVAARCSVSQCVTLCCSLTQNAQRRGTATQRSVAACCSMLKLVAVCCSVTPICSKTLQHGDAILTLINASCQNSCCTVNEACHTRD